MKNKQHEATNMKMALLFCIILLFNSGFLFSQDIITTTMGEEIKVKVLEVSDTDIKYQKDSNIDGPVYNIQKAKIQMIVYSNGEKVVFQKITIPTVIYTSFLSNLTKHGSKVYILNRDINAVKYAAERLKLWNYWIIVEDREKADFILKFTLYNYIDYFGYAEIIEPKTKDVLYVSKEFNTLILPINFNPKKTVIFKIIEQDIIPNFSKP